LVILTRLFLPRLLHSLGFPVCLLTRSFKMLLDICLLAHQAEGFIKHTIPEEGCHFLPFKKSAETLSFCTVEHILPKLCTLLTG